MGIRLFGSFSIITIVAALYLAQPTDTVIPQTDASALPAHKSDSRPAPVEIDALASSSIFPVLVPHQLPVADIAKIAADAAIADAADSDSAQNSAPIRQDPVQGLERTGGNTVQRIESPETLTPVPKTSTSTRNSANASPQPTLADVTFLQHALPAYSPSRASTDASAIVGVSAMRRLPAVRADARSGGSVAVSASQLLKAATAHHHLHDFKAMLRPNGFHRRTWQDMTFNKNLVRAHLEVEPFVVVIDPGHGGTDPGAKGHNGLLEKDLTLDIARRVRLFLTEVDNIDVQLTRHHDYGLSRQSRLDAIKRSAADMVISLHFNHLPQTNVNLVESYYAGRQNVKRSLATQRRIPQGELQHANSRDDTVDLDFTDGSFRLAKTLQQHIFSEVSFDNDHVKNAGVKQKTLFVLTRSFAPAALIEISCLSYAEEAERLESDDYRNRLAAAIVDGIRSYHESIQRTPLNTRDSLGA